MSYRFDVKYAGIMFGTAGGWDQVADTCFYFYDFKPNDALRLQFPEATQFDTMGLQIEWETGIIEIVNERIVYEGEEEIDKKCIRLPIKFGIERSLPSDNA